MYSKILIPVDGRDNAKRALKAAAKALPLCDGEIVLLHVEPQLPDLLAGLELEDVLKKRKEVTDAQVKPVAEFLEANNIRYSVEMANGTVATAIIDTAEKISADLIAMYTDGVDSISDLFIGSITQRVIEGVNIDVLAVRK